MEDIKLKIDEGVINFEINLDMECWSCKGKKEITKKKEVYPYNVYDQENDVYGCCECKGKGYRLTENGESIINLLERHR